MYANRDDARLKPAKANQSRVWAVSIASSLALTGLAIFIASESMDGNYLKAANTPGFAPSPVLTPTPSFRASAPASERLPVNVVVAKAQPIAYPEGNSDRFNQPAAAEAVRQTSFHDGNYVPRGAVNVLPATRVMPNTLKTQAPAKAPEVVVIGQQPKRLSDYCSSRPGSIEQRNCKQSLNLSSRNMPASTR